MKEQLSSGATIEASVASIQLGYSLFQAVIREFKRNGLGFDIDAKDDVLDFKAFFSRNPTGFFDNLLNVISSKEVLDIVLKCAASAVYEKNGIRQKVSWDTFEAEENRADFFEVMFYIAKKNLLPFFPKVHTQSKQIIE